MGVRLGTQFITWIERAVAGTRMPRYTIARGGIAPGLGWRSSGARRGDPPQAAIRPTRPRSRDLAVMSP